MGAWPSQSHALAALPLRVPTFMPASETELPKRGTAYVYTVPTITTQARSPEVMSGVGRMSAPRAWANRGAATIEMKSTSTQTNTKKAGSKTNTRPAQRRG